MSGVRISDLAIIWTDGLCEQERREQQYQQNRGNQTQMFHFLTSREIMFGVKFEIRGPHEFYFELAR